MRSFPRPERTEGTLGPGVAEPPAHLTFPTPTPTPTKGNERAKPTQLCTDDFAHTTSHRRLHSRLCTNDFAFTTLHTTLAHTTLHTRFCTHDFGSRLMQGGYVRLNHASEIKATFLWNKVNGWKTENSYCVLSWALHGAGRKPEVAADPAHAVASGFPQLLYPLAFYPLLLLSRAESSVNR